MEKLKFGIAGLGARGVWCFGNLLKKREDVTIAALCDTNAHRLELAAEELAPEAARYTDIDAMFAGTALDAVIITTPDYYHEECAVKAINANINVLIDKPLATTVKGCQNIIKAAEKAGKVLMIGFNLRHHQVLKKVKELIDKGELGRIFLLENREFYSGGRTYMARWNRFYDQCGGLWIHKGSHDFDVFQWLMDFPKPVKVSAFADISVLNENNLPFEVQDGIAPGPCCHKCHYKEQCPDVFVDGIGDTENGPWGEKAAALDGYVKDTCMYLSEKDNHDNGIAIVEYDNGAKASHMECFINSSTVDDRRFTVVGTKAHLTASLHDRKVVLRPRHSKEIITYDIPEASGGHGGADPTLLADFIATITGKKPNSSTFEQGMWSTAVGQAAEISRRESRMVNVAELFE